MEVKLTAILNLKPADEKRLHPVAPKWFTDQSALVEQEVALYGLTHEDLDALLLDDEMTELVRHKAGLYK